MVVGGVDPLGDYLRGGGDVPEELRGIDLADPLSIMSFEDFMRDYGGDISQYHTQVIASNPDIQQPPAQIPEAITGGFAGIPRGGPGGAESGVGTSIPGGGAAPTETGTVDTGLGSEE